MRNTITTVTISLLLAGTLSLAGTASADNHVTVESLKAQLAGTQAKLATVTAGRDELFQRYLKRTASSKDAQSKLQAEIDSANESRNYMAKRLEAMHDEKYATSTAHAAEMAEAQSAGDSIAETAFAQIKGALAERDAARAQVTAEQNKNNFAEIMLKKAEGSAAANGASASALQDELSAAKAANEKLTSDMESVINGRSYIEKQVSSAKAVSAGLQEELAAAKAANEKLASDMESVINGRSYIEKQVATAKAVSAGLQEELAAAKTELTSINDKAAMAQRSANWSRSAAASLAGELDNVPGVEVAVTSDSKVNLRIGRAGMFKSGNKNLSERGRFLLARVGQALLGHSDSSILVTGHTDNIPTGEGSRYKDNQELSSQRAEEAMNFLARSTGIDLGRMSSTGMGDAKPITSNATAEGRETNRRVELLLSPM